MSYCDRSISVVRRQQFALNDCCSGNAPMKKMSDMAAILKTYIELMNRKSQLIRNLVGSVRATCGSNIAKLVPIRNPRWPQRPLS